MGSSTGRTSAAAGSFRHGPKRLRLKTLGVLAIALLAGLMQALPAPAESRSATVGHLEVDGRGDHPLGVDDTSPRLGWRVERAPDGWAQGAYQIRAARSERDLARGSYLWDSGKVRSSSQNDVEWGGPELRSRQAVVWQVRVWSTRGDVTRWSRPASWEMGLLERSDWGASRWIEYPGRSLSDPLPIFARAFSVDRTARRRGRQGAAVPLGHRHPRGRAQRQARDRRGARAGQLELPAVRGVPDLRRHAPHPSRCEHTRRRARERNGAGHPLRHQSRDRPHRPVRLVAEPVQGQRDARRTCRGRRHRRQGEQRRWLLHRRHHQHRYGRRRRPARVAHDHRDRHRRCRTAPASRSSRGWTRRTRAARWSPAPATRPRASNRARVPR